LKKKNLLYYNPQKVAFKSRVSAKFMGDICIISINFMLTTEADYITFGGIRQEILRKGRYVHVSW
jgi:hypothetical protein